MKNFQKDKTLQYVVAGVVLLFLLFYFWLRNPETEAPQPTDSEISQTLVGDGFHVLSAKVIRVPDGDTVYIKTSEGRETRVRLLGIDAPEGKMPYGEQSRDHLYGLLKKNGFKVDVVYRQHDQYGRIVGKLVSAQKDLNLAQVESGYAWVYRAYLKDLQKGDKTRYLDAEKEAKARRLGLWRDNNPQEPWNWRKQHPRTE